MKKTITIILTALLLLTTIITPVTLATPQSMNFTDVSTDDWFFPAVQFVSANGIMRGTSATTFSPDANFSRAMVVTTLFRIYHEREADTNDSRETSFDDVPTTEWFAPYVSWAAENGIAQGDGSRFMPNSYVDRQQFATMLFRFADAMTDMDTSVRQGPQWNDFTDHGQIASWAVDALIWANYHGFITGRTATTIVPDGNATRAEAATVLMRFMGGAPSDPPRQTLEEAVRAGMSYREILQAFPDADVQTAFEQEVIRLVNEIRREHGLELLIVHPDLARVARERTDEMIRYNSMDNVSPTTGFAHTEHANAMGLNVFYAGENAGWGHMAPRDVVNAWMDSPLHRDGLLVGAEGNRLTVPWAPMPYVGVGFSSGDTHELGTAWAFWIMTSPR